MLKGLWVTLLVAALGLGVAQNPGQCPTSPPTVAVSEIGTTTLSNGAKQGLLDWVWAKVQRDYVYSDFSGLDWNALYDPTLQQALSSTTDGQFYSVLKSLIRRLADGHSRYLTPQEAREEDAQRNGQSGFSGLGVNVRYVAEGVLLTWVFPGSPAEKAGLKQRDVLRSANGKPCPISTDLRGPSGSSVTLEVQSPDGALRQVVVERASVVTNEIPIAKRWPQNPNYGYLALSGFSTNDMVAQTLDALESFLSGPPLQGLVIDVRGNPGGQIRNLRSVLGQFVSGSLGDFRDRRGSASLGLQVTRGTYYRDFSQVPLVVLVDRGTASAGEIFAAVLQHSGRAKVVGVTSSANTEAITAYNLTDGSRLWLAESDFFLPDGTRLGSRGVVPNISLEVEWWRYSEAQDPHILRALELLQSGQASPPQGKASP